MKKKKQGSVWTNVHGGLVKKKSRVSTRGAYLVVVGAGVPKEGLNE